MNAPWPRYSFRAEAQCDVVGLLTELLNADCQFRVEQWTSGSLGEPSVEISTPLTLQALRVVTGLVTDGHVMRETLRVGPLLENTLERVEGGGS